MIQITFDYAGLDIETQAFIKVKAKDIHIRLKRAAADIVAVGQALIEVKARLDHGQFGDWLQSEFGMTDRHARNFMNVASRFGDKTETISDLPATVLYLLAAPSTPEEIVEQVIAGVVPATKGAIREAIEASENDFLSDNFQTYQVYSEKNGFDAAMYMLAKGRMLQDIFEDMASMDELYDFAWAEFRLYPQMAMELMTYAGRYKNPVTVPSQIRQKLEGMYKQFYEEIKKLIWITEDIPASTKSILVFAHIIEEKREVLEAREFSRWIDRDLQIQELIVNTLIGYAQRYSETAIDEISEEDMGEMIDFCAQHNLSDTVNGLNVRLALSSNQRRYQWPPHLYNSHAT